MKANTGFTRNKEPVDPSFEMAWNCEIVHWCSNNHDISRKKFVQNLGAESNIMLEIRARLSSPRLQRGK